MRLMIAGMCFLLAGCEKADPKLEKAVDLARQYEIVERTNPTRHEDLCFRATLTAEAYLQAGDDKNYDMWRTTQGADCAIANLR